MKNGNSEFKIEKAVPIPPAHSGRIGIYASTFAKMKIGDSFQIPLAKRPYAAFSASQFSRRAKPGWKFALRKESDELARIWRVA